MQSPSSWTAIAVVRAAVGGLVLVVVIAAVIAIANPLPNPTREDAYVSFMKSDLQNLIIAQEAYRSQRNSYARTVDELGTTYKSSPNVKIAILGATRTGWQAMSNHLSTSTTCRISIDGTAVNEAEPTCGPN